MAVLRKEEQQRRLAGFFRGVPGSGACRRLFAGCGLLFDARERGLHEPCGGLCVELGQFRIEAQKMPQKRQKGYAPQRRVGGLSPANAALYGALRAAEARFYRAFGNGKSGCDLADAHFEIIVHQHAFALYIGQGGSERGGETAVLLAVERLVRQNLRRAVDKRRGVGLLGRGVPCRGAAQPCGGAHRPEREILVVFQFRKTVQHLAEDFPFGILCAAFVLQHFQAVEIETRLYRAEQFALCLGISPATAREQQARVLVQHSKSPLGLRAAPQNDMVLPQHSFSFYSIVYAQTVVNLQDGKFTKKI